MTFQVDFNDVTRTVVQLNPIHISINCSKFPTSETSSMYTSLVYLLVLFYSSIGCYEWISRKKKKINYNLIILTIDFCLQFHQTFFGLFCMYAQYAVILHNLIFFFFNNNKKKRWKFVFTLFDRTTQTNHFYMLCLFFYFHVNIN